MADKKISATIKLQGEQEYQRAVTSCTKVLGTMKSEMKLVETQTAGSANSLSTLQKKHEVLSKTLEAQNKKIEATSKALEASQKDYTRVGTELDKLKAQYTTAKTALEQMKASGTASDTEMKEQEKTVSALATAVEKGEVTYTTAGDRVQDWQKKLNTAQAEEAKLNTSLEQNDQYLSEAKTSTDGCATSIDKFGKQTQETTTEVANFGESAKKYFTVDLISQYADKASAAMSSLAKSAYSATTELDEGYDTLIEKTGATGDQLENLKEVSNDVYGSMPTEMADVGNAVGTVSARFDESGAKLKNTSTIFLEFANITNSDVNDAIDSTDHVLKQFNTSTDQAGNFLGMLTKKSQETGKSASDLMSTLDSNAPTFQILDMNLAQATSLLATMEKNGVDTDQAMKGLKKSVATYTSAGKTAREGLELTISSIKNAKTETEALKIAQDTFGTKGFAAMEQGIRSGKISLDDLSDSLDNYASTVDDTYQATLDPWDQWTVSANNLKLAGSDLAGTFLDTCSPAIDTFTEVIKNANEAIDNMPPGVKEAVSVVGALALGAGTAAPQIIKLVVAIKALKAADATTESLKNLSGVEKEAAENANGFVSALAAHPLAGAVGIVGTVTAACVGLAAVLNNLQAEESGITSSSEAVTSKLSESTSTLKSNMDVVQKSIDSVSAAKDTIGPMVSELESLSKQTSRTADQQSRMQVLVNELNNQFPDLGLAIDDTTGSLNMSNSELEDYVKNLEDTAKAQAYLSAITEGWKAVAEAQADAQSVQKDNQDVLDAYQEVLDKIDAVSEAERNGSIDTATAAEEQAALQQQLSDMAPAYKSAEDAVNSQNDAISQAKDKVMALEGEYQNLIGGQQGATSSTSSLQQATIQGATAFQDETTAVNGLIQAHQQEKTAVDEANTSHHESISVAGQELTAFNNLSTSEQQLAVNVTNAVATMQSSVEGSIQSQCDWFGKLDDSGKTSAQSIIDSMQKQVDSVHNWEQNLTTLSTYTDSTGQHIDSGLLQSLADLGPQGAAYVQALVDDGGASLDSLNSTWQEKVDMTSMTDKWGQDLTQGIGTLAAGSDSAWNQLGTDLNLEANNSGKFCVQGLVDGMSAAKAQLTTSGDDAAKSLLNSLNSSLGVASPSTKTYQSGSFVIEGLVNGINGSKGLATSAATSAATEVINAINTALGGSGGSSFVAYGAGANIGSGLSNGMYSQMGSVRSAAAYMGNTTIQALTAAIGSSGGTSSKSIPAGRGVALGVATGMKAAAGHIKTAATSVATSTIQALGSALGTSSGGSASSKTTPIGRGLSLGLANGITASMSRVSSAATTTGNTAVNSMRSAASSSSMYGIGRNLSEGLANGILSGLGDVSAAASAIAAQAEIASRARLQVNSPSKVFIKIGSSVGEGMVKGIDSGVNDVKASVVGVSNSAINAARDTLQTHSPSKVFVEIGKYVIEGLTDGIEEKSDDVSEKITSTVTKATEEAEHITFSFASAEEYAAQEEENWFKAMDRLGEITVTTKEKEFARNTVSRESINIAGQSVKAFERLSASQEKLAVKVTNAMTTMQASVKSALTSQMDMFTAFDGGEKISSQQVISNMESQVAGVQSWETQLAALADRGINQDLLQKLSDMGPKGLAYVQAFTDMTTEEFKKANDLWKESISMKNVTDSVGAALTTATGELAAGGKKAFTDLAADLNVKSRRVGGNVAKGIIDGMAEAKEQIQKQAKSSAKTILSQLNTSLGVASPSKETFKSGMFVAQGLANGITAGQSLVISAAVAVAAAAVSAAKATLQVKSPSKVFEGIGQYVDEGFANGVTKSSGVATNAVRNALNFSNMSAQIPQASASDMERSQLEGMLVTVMGSANGHAAMQIIQNIYANSTSYSDQQKQAAKQFKKIAGALS